MFIQKQGFKYFLFFTLLTLCSSLFGRVHQGYGGSLSKMKAFKHSSFFLNKLTFESDIPFSDEEFFYLTELTTNSFVDLDHIDRAYQNLMNKNRFSAINIDLIEEGIGKHLHFTLLGNWVLRKLDFRGIIFGKHHYTSLYAQQPGDVFDATLHEESLKSIKKILDDQGYFDHIVTDELFYSKGSKTIKVAIKVARNKRFTINNVTFEIADPAQHDEDDVSEIQNRLDTLFKKTFMNVLYSKEHIHKQINKIRKLLKGEDFLNSRIAMSRAINHDKKNVALLFTITLGKRKILTFEGNELFSERYIKEELIGLDQPDWLFSPDIITEQLLHEYYKKGYWESDVTYEKINTHGYAFFIEEGEPVLIEHIEVKDIDTQIPEEAAFFWTDLLKNKALDQNLLDESIEKLKNFYIADGFWDFKIIEKRFVKNSGSEKYSITLLISKGKQRFWGGLAVPDFKHLEFSDFFKKYMINSPYQLIPFNINWLKEQKISLLQHFQKTGFWYVNIQPELRIAPLEPVLLKKASSPDSVKVCVDWTIHLGPQVKFGKLLVRGNTKLPFKRILKEVKFKEGDLWDKEKIELTRKKLKRLDIFKQVQIQPYQLSKNKSKKPIILSLIDDDPVELRMRAGYFLTSKNFLFRRESTPKFGASLVVKNPTNRADRFALEADVTKFERKLNVGYQQPSFIGLPGMSKLNGYANKYVHPVQIASSSSAYEAHQNGFLVGLSDEYKDYYYWGLSIGNEWIKTSRVRGNLKFNQSLIDKTLPYLFIEPSLIIDKLDDRVNTTKGSLSFISLKMMFPENKGDLTARLMLEESLFYPIYGDIIIAARARFGHIFRRKFENIMPIERFYLGGPYSVRGYEKDALPPLGVSDRIEAGKTIKEFTIQGGGSMINGNLELRFPLFNKIGTVLFQDVGVLSQSGLAGFKQKEKWFPSSGFGFRYKTPIGAFRFDIGWKWQKRLEGDSPYAWYLTLGEAF